MARLTIESLTKRFLDERGRPVTALNGLALAVEEGEFLALLGPSGCGKTTLLRLIAGLETPDQGWVFMDGVPLNNVAPKDRDIAMVFQSHALFPHLTARENMAFGLMLRKLPRSEIVERVHQAAEMLDLKELLDRKPAALSGGQCQRVALGRALVRQPKVFLLDEPLSNLDAPMRVQLREKIRKIHQQCGGLMIYVTHDQSEASALGDRIGVMNQGTMEQVGTLEDLKKQPATPFVQGFIHNIDQF